MSYIVKSSERLRKPSAEMETKALMYLMSFRNDSDDIHYFIVDFFNDLTGMDRVSTKLWDLQSKGASNSSPKAIGKELVTLYKNYISKFTFDHLILFMGGVSPTLRINDSINIFNISNIKPDAKNKLIEGLKEECKAKTYIDKTKITDISIENFIDKVLFVIDDKSPAEYVKAIIKNHPNIIPEDDVLNAIFNEIKNEQSSKKNGCVVENLVIQTSDEALNYYRHLTNNEIRLMTLQRIIHRDPLETGIPVSFIPIYSKCPPEGQKNILDDCQSSLCRALFNKSMAQNFWILFSTIYSLILKNPNDSVQELFNKIDRLLIDNCPDFDVLSVKYFIAVVKDGIQK